MVNFRVCHQWSWCCTTQPSVGCFIGPSSFELTVWQLTAIRKPFVWMPLPLHASFIHSQCIQHCFILCRMKQCWGAVVSRYVEIIQSELGLRQGESDCGCAMACGALLTLHWNFVWHLKLPSTKTTVRMHRGKSKPFVSPLLQSTLKAPWTEWKRLDKRTWMSVSWKAFVFIHPRSCF